MTTTKNGVAGQYSIHCIESIIKLLHLAKIKIVDTEEGKESN